jgi:hypothetical protein
MAARLIKAAGNIIAAIVRLFGWWFGQIARQDTLRAKAVVVCVGLLALCVVCSVPVSLVNGPKKPTPAVASAPSVQPTTAEVDAPTSRPTAKPTSVPPTHTPLPSATAEPPTPTPEPTNTPVPTEIPIPTAVPPTATPEPTNTPVPTEIPIPTAVPQLGLGISRVKAEQSYKKLGFRFQDAPLSDGRERRMAMASDKLSNIELIGTADELSEISVMVAPTSDPDQNTASVAYMLTAFNLAVPKWAHGATWLSDNIRELSDDIAQGKTDGERTTTVQGRTIKLSFVNIGGPNLLFLHIDREES